MGVEKASMEVLGKPLICRVVDAVAHCGPVHVVGGEPSLLELISNCCDGTPTVDHYPDVEESPGPFGAMTGALERVTNEVLLVVSCDLATLTPGDVDRLLEARRASDADIAVPLVDGARQWHAIAMSRRIIPRLLQSRSRGTRSMRQGLAGLSECTVVSADHDFFADVDTPEDVLGLGRV